VFILFIYTSSWGSKVNNQNQWVFKPQSYKYNLNFLAQKQCF